MKPVAAAPRRTTRYRIRFIAEHPDNPDAPPGFEPRPHGIETPTALGANPDRAGAQPRRPVGGTKTNDIKNDNNNPAPVVADVFGKLGIENLRDHPNATPERLAWIEREAPKKINPGGFAAAAIKGGCLVPAPTPQDEQAARKARRIETLRRFDALAAPERAAIIAMARHEFPNLVNETDDSAGMRGAIFRVLDRQPEMPATPRRNTL